MDLLKDLQPSAVSLCADFQTHYTEFQNIQLSDMQNCKSHKNVVEMRFWF